MVVVSMTLGGTLTEEQVTKQVEQQLVAAVAYSMGVPDARVRLLSFKNARRRLLALTVTFQIFAGNTQDAQSIKQKIEGADLQVFVCCAWLGSSACLCMYPVSIDRSVHAHRYLLWRL